MRIGCTLPDALAAARTGQRVLFDDGKIGGIVASVRAGEIEVSIVYAAPQGTKLRAEKGISLPDTELDVAALGTEDLALLPVIVECADLVGLSFAQRADDITALQGRLASIDGDGIGIILKIETRRGFDRLPEMLLAAMASERVGVMVARGDLAVECGFERPRSAGGDPVALRSGPRSDDLGDPGARPIAGLVIYWCWSNTLTILQQWYITKMHVYEKAKKGKS